MVRGIVQETQEGAIKRVNASGRADESFTDRECIQHYGFSSRPLAGAEAILLNEGNHVVMIGSDDRRYRVAVEAGEVTLYTDEGDKIHFKRGKEIQVTAGVKVVVSAPDIVINGNVEVNGSIHATGSIIDGAGNTNHHSH
jgi:phage gp45-like